ncbi:hypothetical protein TeGR_g3086 [Tetraparma gracilis]|uniref:Uncharacterized protein n=1 Tax=Tetraparma gracilis TaxID=2962635 RepID=A0ABQ6MFF9_9STRA|nr:hypothetical protein TeGR_g3086 [Tetraparma gracilis]
MAPRVSRRRSGLGLATLRARSALAAYALPLSSQIRLLLLESTGLALLAAALPALTSFAIGFAFRARMRRFRVSGGEGLSQAAVYSNATGLGGLAVVPFQEKNFARFFVTSYRDAITDPGFVMVFMRAVLPPLLLTVLVTLYQYERTIEAGDQGARDGFYSEESRATLYSMHALMLANGVAFSTWVHVMTSPEPRPLLCAAAFAGLAVFESFCAILYTWYAVPIFFSPSTSEFARFVIRTVFVTAVNMSALEVCWFTSNKLVTLLGVDPHRSHMLFAASAAFVTFMARMMQGSAESLTQAVLFELSGTIAELRTADSLLRGATPIGNTKKDVRDAAAATGRAAEAAASTTAAAAERGKVTLKNAGKMAHGSLKKLPGVVAKAMSGRKNADEEEEGGEGGGERDDPSSRYDLSVRYSSGRFSARPSLRAEQDIDPDETPEEREKAEKAENRRIFCGAALMMHSISECTNIFAATGYYTLLSANPGAAGSPSIPFSQSMTNLAVMLVGELIVTDGIIAYIARHSKRYSNDPAHEWQEFRSKKYLVMGIGLTCAAMGSACILQYPVNFCYTSWLGGKGERGELDWVVTSCPEQPKNFTELSAVGESYANAWAKYADLIPDAGWRMKMDGE